MNPCNNWVFDLHYMLRLVLASQQSQQDVCDRIKLNQVYSQDGAKFVLIISCNLPQVSLLLATSLSLFFRSLFSTYPGSSCIVQNWCKLLIIMEVVWKNGGRLKQHENVLGLTCKSVSNSRPKRAVSHPSVFVFQRVIRNLI